MEMIEATAACAMLGGALGAIGSIPYLRDIWRRSTVPHRGSWFIWSVIEVVAVESQRADGARWSMIPLVTQAAGTCVVFALSLPLGTGGVSRVELALIALAGGGVLGWFMADEPVIATACVIIADFIAALMMLPKAWRYPHSETTSTFALSSLGGVMTVGSVGVLSLPLLIYPVYFFFINAILTLLICYRRAADLSAGARVLRVPPALQVPERARESYAPRHRRATVLFDVEQKAGSSSARSSVRS